MEKNMENEMEYIGVISGQWKRVARVNWKNENSVASSDGPAAVATTRNTPPLPSTTYYHKEVDDYDTDHPHHSFTRTTPNLDHLHHPQHCNCCRHHRIHRRLEPPRPPSPTPECCCHVQRFYGRTLVLLELLLLLCYFYSSSCCCSTYFCCCCCCCCCCCRHRRRRRCC